MKFHRDCNKCRWFVILDLFGRNIVRGPFHSQRDAAKDVPKEYRESQTKQYIILNAAKQGSNLT